MIGPARPAGYLVPLARVERALLAELDFESSASTNSATGAWGELSSARPARPQPPPPPTDSGEGLRVLFAGLGVRAEAIGPARALDEQQDDVVDRDEDEPAR